MRISEVLHRNIRSTKRSRARPQVDWHSVRSSNDLTKLTRELTKDGAAKHSWNLNWRQPFLSKTRFLSGRQCSKKLWQTVYNPEPVAEPLPGTVKGMGIEVGIKARLLWCGGVLVDTKYDDYAEAIKRTKALMTTRKSAGLSLSAEPSAHYPDRDRLSACLSPQGCLMGRFVPDSALEGGGFEPSVPLCERSLGCCQREIQDR